MGRILVILWVTFASLLPEFSLAGESKTSQAQRLFHETLTHRDSLPRDRYLHQLQRVVRLDKKLAAAWHALGLAWLDESSVGARRHAHEALRRAVFLQPANTDFRYDLAQCLERRDLVNSAKSEYRKILELDPLDGRPYFHLALFAEAAMLRYRDMVSLHGDATIYFDNFAQDDYAEAVVLFKQAIAVDPTLAPAYHRLAALYFEAGRYREMEALLQQALAIPSNPQMPRATVKSAVRFCRADLHLWLGLAYARLGETALSQASFDSALAGMSPAERACYQNVAPLLSPDSRRSYLAWDESQQMRFVKDFWHSRDPLFLTAANERQLEHYCRVAYANLRYGDPETNLAGWNTDRGKVIIRYGFPAHRLRTRADLGTTPAGRTTFNASKETWRYDNFYMRFEDRFMSQDYQFALSMNPYLDGKNLFGTKIEQEPERFDFDFGGQRLPLPLITAQFKSPGGESGNTLLEVYYGLPIAFMMPVDESAESKVYAFERGLFLCDERWEMKFDRKEMRELNPWQGNTASGYLIDRWPLAVPPGNYNFSLEAHDRLSGHAGAERGRIAVEDFDNGLQLSSVILAKRIECDRDDLTIYQKGDLQIIPNLSAMYDRHAPVYLYFEVYNLAQDAEGNTRFRVENSVHSVGAKRNAFASSIGSLTRLLGFSKSSSMVTSSFETGGTTRDEPLHYSIALPGATTGEYRLTIRVTDLIAGTDCERLVTFHLF